MSTIAVKAVVSAKMPAPIKSVALIMGWHANTDNGLTYPSVPTIARETGLSESSVKRALRWLVERKVLQCVERSAGGQRKSSVYVFNDRHKWVTVNPVHSGPRSPSRAEPVQRDPQPRPGGPPKEIEAEAKPLLQSKGAAHASVAAAGGRASTRAGALTPVAVAHETPPKTKQPPSEKGATQAARRLPPQPPGNWTHADVEAYCAESGVHRNAGEHYLDWYARVEARNSQRASGAR